MEENKVNNEKDLAQALIKEKDCIELEGRIKDCVLKIKATGKVTWLICAGIIAIAALELTKVTRPSSESEVPKKLIASAIATPVVVYILGSSAFMAAASIAMEGGGISVLNKLRDYNVQNLSDNKIRLIKK